MKKEKRPEKKEKGSSDPLKQTVQTQTRQPAAISQSWMSSSEDEDEKEEACLFCNTLYLDSKSREGWIR